MLYICYYFIVIVIFYLVFTVRTSSLELFVRLLCEINWIEIHALVSQLRETQALVCGGCDDVPTKTIIYISGIYMYM